MASTFPSQWNRALLLGRAAVRAGTAAGLAMIPFAAVFRAQGLRVNEYGRKTLALVISDVGPELHTVLTFVQHLIISWVVALPLIGLLARVERRSTRVLIGGVYGLAFYVVVNAWALPHLFGDRSPWELGIETVYPSLVIHLVYGVVVGLVASAPDQMRGIFRGAGSAQRRARRGDRAGGH